MAKYVVEHSPDLVNRENDIWTSGMWVDGEWVGIEDFDSPEAAQLAVDCLNAPVVSWNAPVDDCPLCEGFDLSCTCNS